MNRLIGVMMLVFVIGAEIVGLAQWISPASDYAERTAVTENVAR